MYIYSHMQLEKSMKPQLDPVALEASAGEAAELLSVLANTNRLLVLCNLMDGEMAVQELADVVGMNQSALSQQLAKLRALKLVATRREGRTIYYRVASKKVEHLLETLYDIYCGPEAEDSTEETSDLEIA